MTERPPAPPPELPGLTHVELLGSGGFADVFLYVDDLLGRKVAVKVLLPGQLADDNLQQFTNEANLMARLSGHPSIVTVYQAAVSADGRPYLVMEYCSRPNLHTRFRAAPFSELETLRIGVQIAGAVETAHRAGILHRDIKPANILVTDYGRPALTDFGIASAGDAVTRGGLSVPWAPPEALRGQATDERSDVYSLAATLYTLLAGHSPFAIVGASNTTAALTGRITSGELPSLERPDVSGELAAVLGIGMAPDPAARYPSAMSLAHALQRVQIARSLPPTPLDVVDEAAESDEPDDDGHTRIRLPEATAPALGRPQPLPGTTAVTGVLRAPGAAVQSATDHTVLRTTATTADNAGLDPATGAGPAKLDHPNRSFEAKRRKLWIVAAVAALALGSTAYAVAAGAGRAAQPAPAAIIATTASSTPISTPEPSPTNSAAAVPTSYHCWDGAVVADLAACKLPTKKAADWAYLRYAFPAIDDHGLCKKRDSSKNSDYTGDTVMWDCELGSALLRYRYWEKASDGKRHFARKYSAKKTRETYNVLLSATNEALPGWAKEARARYRDPETGTNRYVLSIWIPEYHLSITAEGDSRKAMRKAVDQLRIRPTAELLGRDPLAEAQVHAVKLKKRG